MAKRVDNSNTGTNYPTQLSIAREAGLSRTTVAEILAGKRLERYNDETQRKVFEVARRLNYRPHRSAQEVRRGRSNLIGVFHSSSAIQAASERALGLGRAIMRSGFELFLNDGLWYDGDIEHSIGQMLSARVEGVIISGPMQIKSGRSEELLNALKSANIPAVTISTYSGLDAPHVPSIAADFTQGFRALTDHLVERGCRRMIIEACPSLPAGQVRYQGFQEAIAAHCGTLHPVMEADQYRNPWQNHGGIEGVLVDMKPTSSSELHDPCSTGSRFLEELLKGDVETDAILASNDYRAFGMLTTCYRRGLNIPEAFAVTGADNSYLSRQGPVPITTLEQPIEEMCNLAVETLVHHIKGTATSRHQGGTLPCRVIVRDSSAINLDTSIPTPISSL